MKYWFIAIAIATLGCGGPKPGEQVLIKRERSHVIPGYWLYLPPNYDESKPYPLIVFLQGGDGSTSSKYTKNAGPVRKALETINANQRSLTMDSFIIVNPYMKVGRVEERQWYMHDKELVSILDDLSPELSYDKSRVYITGLSRGGHGAFGVFARHPDRFAACLPIAGRVKCANRCDAVSDKPIWVVHDRNDPTVDYQHAVELVENLEALGADFHRANKLAQGAFQTFTTLDVGRHDAWTETYDSEWIYEWFLEQRID